MFYIESPCPLCKTGSRGFRRCSDNTTIVLMCDECELIWLNPKNMDLSEAVHASPPSFIIPGLNCSFGGAQSGWATREEIDAQGWVDYIAGQGKALDG